ncbi:phasin family protein [Hydrogenophaga sp. IBVHS2]|uniref:phasin family protein n=1 Tax=Hydrogenophaga sp. IBVHS2 TaxID=1985170 RepID=UPI000A2E4560|nr:phasin family protein [Hydrogenophaga sp. IBVHS2]OSZ64818.1 poly granule associated protein [Hydrogenophaga sp. IBVHS2]
MVKKVSKSSNASSATKASGQSALSGAIKDSAQQIWLAGLGAFSKAQAEGGKAFETLVKEGLSIQRKTQAVAEERISEATSRVSSMANDISSKAAGKWDKLESLFEERVAKALGTLGVPTARDIEALMARIDELNAHVAQLTGQAPARKRAAAKPAARPAAKAAVKVAAKPAAKAPARKRAAAKSAKSTPAA